MKVSLSQTLQSEDIRLEKTNPQQHAAVLFDLIVKNRKQLKDTIPWNDRIQTVQDKIEFIKTSNASWEELMQFDYVVINKKNEIVGCVGVHSLSWNDLRCEMGYWMASEYYGFGYMSQAVSLLEEECFQKGIQRIEMSIDTLNYPSIKLARGLGYHFEGLLREESRLYSDEKQKPRSTLIFSKLKKDQIVLSPEEKNIIEQAKTYPKLPLTVTIIAYNEESNIARAIQSVLPLTQDIVVIDSGSSDRTVAIARAWGARVSYEPWRGYGQQKNYAQSKVKNDWILNLDADEECTQELRDEIRNLFIQKVASAHQAYAFPRLSYFLNQQIHHGGWYPNFSTRLYLKDSLVWSEPTVHETLISKTSEPVSIGKLKSQLYHYPFQSIREQIETNLKFSRLGYESHKKNQSFVKVKMLFKPLWKFVHVYFIQLGFLDGWHGFVIAVNAMHSMFLRFAYHLEIENNVQNNVQNKNQRKLKS